METFCRITMQPSLFELKLYARVINYMNMLLKPVKIADHLKSENSSLIIR